MRLNSEIPWERYALIAELVRRFESNSVTLRKTALQKMIFLLERSFGVDCDYNYTLYTYGPFCADVARDLEIVESFGGVTVEYDPNCRGYDLRPGPATDELRARAQNFLAQISNQLDQLIGDYGRASAKDLELRSTITYLAKPDRTDEELIQQVRQVKPHFPEQLIAAALHELQEKGYLDRVTQTLEESRASC